MNIVFISDQNPENHQEWSGTLWYIYRTLQKNHQVFCIGMNLHQMIIQYTDNNFCKKKSNLTYSSIIGKLYTEVIERIPNVDLFFLGDMLVNPFLKSKLPKFFFSDITFQTFQKEFFNRSKINPQTENAERIFLHSFDNVIYTSEWISSIVAENYNLPFERIKVIEFGANIPHPETYQREIETSICHIVFIGRHWKKKGGDIAFEAVRILQNQGFPCKMTFIGCTPPPNESLPESTKIIPFLDKSKPEELERLCSILYEAHFLLLPTRFDAFGIVFAEASAYGVPSIATNVGGTSQAIREGKNGYLLPLEAGAEEYANKIKEVFADKESYYQLRRTSRKEYETRLNWDVWLKRVNKVFEETVSNYKKQNNKNE